MGIEKTDAPRRTTQRTRVWIWGIVAVATLGAAAVVAAVAIEPGSIGGVPTPSETEAGPAPYVSVAPVPPAAPSDPGALDDGSAETLVTTVLDAVATTPPGADPAAVLAGVAEGSYLSEIAAQYQELDTNGWTISGQPVVETAVVTSLDTQVAPATAVVSACIDSSGVTTLDSAGVAFGGQTAPRSTHLFGLAQSADGTWKITSHWFPDDAAC